MDLVGPSEQGVWTTDRKIPLHSPERNRY